MYRLLKFDYGESYIGIAVTEFDGTTNRVLFAATMLVERLPITKTIARRNAARRARRTRKTKLARLRNLRKAISDTGLLSSEAIESICRFCRRRGYGYVRDEETDTKELVINVSREQFFTSLENLIKVKISNSDTRDRILKICKRTLSREIRPMRIDNRNPSKCDWEGCNKNVPRAKNAKRERLQQALYGWLVPVFSTRPKETLDTLYQNIDAWITDAVTNPDDMRRLGAQLRKIVPEEEFQQHWTGYYQKNISDILHGRSEGRTTFCREHSDEYARAIARREVPPRKNKIGLGDIGRVEQKIFMDLWRYVEARILPLVGQIDEISVERVAFDMLVGYRPKKINGESKGISDKAAYDLYTKGPRYGFDDNLDMLTAEFGGRCAYCGRSGLPLEVEDMLPSSRFGFGAYLNLVPACRECNQRKGNRTPREAGMCIHDDAYSAYCKYLENRKIGGFKVRHPFHDIKKGVLNRMRNGQKHFEAEEILTLSRLNFARTGDSQKSPRPLAKFMSQKIQEVTGMPCEIKNRSGRETALLRGIMLPDYVKSSDDIRNHAIDAIIMGCKVPSLHQYFKDGGRPSAAVLASWETAVRRLAPQLQDGIPVVELPTTFEPVPYFEKMLPGGYVEIALSNFNWNKKNQSGHGLDPVGVGKDGKDVKRYSADEFLNGKKGLKDCIKRKDEKGLRRCIESTRKKSLREAMLRDIWKADEIFLGWLRKSIGTDEMSQHPADLARGGSLESFAVGTTENPTPFHGIAQSVTGGNFSVSRVDKNGKVISRFQAGPSLRAMIVGYKRVDGEIDESRPYLFEIRQTHQINFTDAQRKKLLANNPLVTGRPLGSQEAEKDFLVRWKAAWKDYCEQNDIGRYVRLTQGCVIERSDGSTMFVRNFDMSKTGYLRKEMLHSITRVYRSPLQIFDRWRDDDKVCSRLETS